MWVARLRADPQEFLDAVKTPAILDEVQNVPEVFAHVRSRIDRYPRRSGQWLLTGSQEARSPARRRNTPAAWRFCECRWLGLIVLEGADVDLVVRPQVHARLGREILRQQAFKP